MSLARTARRESPGRRARAAACVVLLAAFAPARGLAQPADVFYDESAAYAGGASVFRLNPAGTSVRYPSELSVTYVDDPFRKAPLFGSLEANGFRFSLGGRTDELLAYSLGIAGGSDALRQGIQLDGTPRPSGGRSTSWRYGFLSRPAPWLSLGGTALDLDRPRTRAYVLGLGLRPFALDRTHAHTLGTRLTLTADARLSEVEHPRDAAFRAGAELEVLPGLVVRGSYEDHTHAYRLGIGLAGVRARLDGGSSYTKDGDRLGSVWTATFHDAEDRTAFTGRSERRVAVVRLAGTLGDDDLSGFNFEGTTRTASVAPVHRQLERALEDPLTRGVLVDLRGVGNLAQLEELRPRLQRLRAAGKPIVAYLEYGATRGDLYLASACDRVVTSPEATYGNLGLLVERRYYRKLLADLGVRIDRTSYGAYKSAYREFSVDSTTAADRESFDHLLDARQDLFVSTVAEGRRMERARLLEMLDGRPWLADDARRAGLVDSVGYRRDALRLLGTLAGLGPKPRAVGLASRPPATEEWTVPARIAVVYASGSIDIGASGNDLLLGPYMGSETMSRQIEAAFRRRDVKAVVFRVESPGGSSLGSDLIHHTLARMKRETNKPLIVSMGRLAGSGGYEISVPGDRIFADRFTSTGSIGVYFVRASLEGFYRKHGVHEDDFMRGTYMRGWGQGRDWDAEMQAVADSSTVREYRDFVSRVAAERGLPWDDVERAAQGRVWTGDDAVRLKLVDEIGGLEAAVAEARRRASVPPGEKIRPIEYRRPQGNWFQRVAGSFVRTSLERSLRLPEPGRALRWDDPDIED